MELLSCRPIARIENDFTGLFGIPRQSGLLEQLESRIVFEKPYGQKEAVRGLESFSHLWLIWQFSEHTDPAFHATVRPPRLGGNTRVGVFATRSPFRPNPIGLSCVKLERIEVTPRSAPVLIVTGADLLSGTPILDIKPYLPLTDARPDARAGFAEQTASHALTVQCPDNLLARVPETKRSSLIALLAQDPRPGYQNDPSREYIFSFAHITIRFHVNGTVLTVTDVEPE